MARVVLTSWGSYGDVYPFLGVALALRDRGHEPVLALPPAYRDVVTREGLAFRPIRPDVDVHDRAFAARIMDPARGADVTFGQVLIPSLAETVSDLREAVRDAHLLVTHPASLAGPIVAAEMEIRWASTVLAPMSFFSEADPVVPPPAPWIHALTSRSRTLARLFHWQTERITRRWAQPVQRFREARGLDPGGNPILDGQHAPGLVLALFSRVLATRRADRPDQVVVTGPVLYDGPGPAVLEPEVRAFVEAGPAPLVFTLGTSAVGAAGSFYEVSAGVARRLGRRAVLLVGPHGRNRPTVSDPDVLVVDRAPHSALFPHAAAIVHQGGAGTLHQALAAGRPMLVVPWAHDQPDNAERVRRLGVARVVRPGRYSPRRVARALRLLLDDPEPGARAAELAEVVRSEPGARGAADTLETLLS